MRVKRKRIVCTFHQVSRAPNNSGPDSHITIVMRMDTNHMDTSACCREGIIRRIPGVRPRQQRARGSAARSTARKNRAPLFAPMLHVVWGNTPADSSGLHDVALRYVTLHHVSCVDGGYTHSTPAHSGPKRWLVSASVHVVKWSPQAAI